MISRIRKNCKRLKSSIKKNKYKGGLTSKSGVYGFFVNKSQWDKLFGAIVKDADAPSISKIEDSLKYQGYFFKKGSGEIDVIGAEQSPISKDFKGFTFQSECRGYLEYATRPCTRKVCDDYSGFSGPVDRTERFRIKDLQCHAAVFSELIPSDEEKFNDIVHDILGFMRYHYKFNKNLDINCCVFIDVSQIKKNTYTGFIDYDNERNEERKKSSLITIGKNFSNENNEIQWFCADLNHIISDKYSEICPSIFKKKID